MCLAIPGKVIEIEKDNIVVDYGVEKRTANASAVDVQIGDYVIINNKVIVSKLTIEEAENFFSLLYAQE